MTRTQMAFNLTAALILSAIAVAWAAETRGPDAGRQGPPPEAYSACEGKKAGDSSKFTDHRGETLTGSCEQENGRLVLRPERNKGQGGERRQGPPPEAYTACQGRKAGDPSQFVDPRGETLSGTCEQEGDRLVLRPDRRKTARGMTEAKPIPGEGVNR